MNARRPSTSTSSVPPWLVLPLALLLVLGSVPQAHGEVSPDESPHEVSPDEVSPDEVMSPVEGAATEAALDALPLDRVLVRTADGHRLSTALPPGAVVTGYLDGLGITLVEVPTGSAASVASSLAGSPDIAFAEPEGLVHAARIPNDPRWPQQWGARLVRAPVAWDITVGYASVVVAVVDTGVSPHADLPSSALTRGYNAIDGSRRVADDDPTRHGTQVATVLAARGNNGQGIAGYCWRCSIMPVKVLTGDGFGTVSWVADGIRTAVDEGADVINLSLGGAPGQVASPTLQAAVTYAEARGVTVVAAAGNGMGNPRIGSTDPTYPAAFPTVIGVSGSDPDDQRYGWSNHGRWVTVSAPGCHQVPGFVAQPFCGTSSASPAVAGTIALLKTIEPSARPARFRELLASTARPRDFVATGRIDMGAAVAGTQPATQLRGDWNGDGTQTPGWFRGGVFHLRNRNGAGPPDHVIRFGRAQDIPVVGDWNGNGRDTIGVVRDGEWHLKNSLSGGRSDRTFVYGRVTRGDIPLVGDWNGNGRDTVGIVRDGEWHLRNRLSGGTASVLFVYGRVTRGDRPIPGNWNGDGRDTPGIVRSDTWHLRNHNSGGGAAISFRYLER